MPAVFYENSELEIGKDDVFENDDIAELKGWLDEQRETAGEIMMMLGALKMAPGAEANGLARKLGYINISVAWITKRLKQLGVDGDELVAERDQGIRKQFRILEGVVQQHKATIKALNIENSDLRNKVSAYERNKAGPHDAAQRLAARMGGQFVLREETPS